MSIKASNNPFPHDPDDNWKEKLDRGGFAGTAQDLKNQIDTIAYPDDILVKGTIVKNGNDITIAALAFVCRIDQGTYSNSDNYSATIAAATEGYYRMDKLVLTKYSTIVKIQGPEGLESAQEPETPEGTIQIGFFFIYGGDVSEPELPDFSLFVDRVNNQIVKGEKTFEDKAIFKGGNIGSYITILNDKITFLKNQLLGNKGSVSLTASGTTVGNYNQQLQGKDGVVALVEDVQNVGKIIAEAPEKLLVDDNDKIVVSDSQDTNKTKYWKFATVKTVLKNYFDTLYQKIFGIINISGTSYQLLLSDNGNKIVSTGAAAVSLTIPTNALVAFPIGSRIKVTQQGDGVITLITTGLTIVSSSALFTIKGQTITLEKTALNTWSIEGNNLNGEIRLPAFPNTRNDGQIPNNRVLGTDVNGNLKLYTIATSPAPFLDEIIPDSYSPSTTGNFILKGAFFTPTMTVTVTGQTVNYVTFISDNEVRANVTTGSAEGTFDVTLNNGLSAIFPKRMLIILGTIYRPIASEWTNVTGAIDVSQTGEVYSTLYNSLASAKWNRIFDNTKKYSVRFNLAVSPLGQFSATTGTDTIFLSLVNATTLVEDFKLSIRADGVPTLRFKYFGPSTNNYVSASSSGANYNEQLTYLGNQSVEFRKVGSALQIYYNNVFVYSFPETISSNYNLLVRVKSWDIINIKYIELV